jgi:hypothetical protein
MGEKSMRRDTPKASLRGFLVGLAVGLAGFGLGTRAPQIEAAGGVSAETAKDVLSQARGIPAEQFTVARSAPLGDTGIRRFKLVDPEGKIHEVNLDALGNPVSREEVERAVQELNHRSFVGKLEAELADLVARHANRPINVVFWLKGMTPRPLRSDRMTPAEDEADRQAIRAQTAAIERPLVNQLRGMGQRVIYQAHYAPAVVVRATPSAIRAMAARSDVERVYLERTHSPRLNVSPLVVQADLVNVRGITGVGRKVAVVEVNRIGTHPNLPEDQRVLCRPEASRLVSGHKTAVAGVIQSADTTFPGMAAFITIVDGIGANFSDAEMMAATDCVIAAGADTVNMSFGRETNGIFDAFARYVDGTVYLARRTIVVAISNFCANRVGSPEIAFNSFAVGAFGDNNTVSLADDVPACTAPVGFSAFLNPISPNGDRQEPDFVAPGHLISTTNAAGGFSEVTGTSFAAPHVTGGAGLLIHRQPTLSSQPEEIRAIMMASARHNIEGESRLSDRDGAGGVMLAAADRVKLNDQSGFISTGGDPADFPISILFGASAGERVRVAIAWAHKSPGGDTETRPTTDLDLFVFLGKEILSSTSFDNNYEIVEFIAPETATYRFEINNFRPSPGAEFIGWAVSRTDS